MHICTYCGSKFKNPITSGHTRVCPEYSSKIPPACLCDHESTSLTQMKIHRKNCIIWNSRDKNVIRLQRMIKTLKSKYGNNITNPIHIPESNNKKSSTMLERYGATNIFSRESSLFNKVQSYWEGKDRTQHLPKNNFANIEIKEKIKKYWLDNYGVENPSQVFEIREKQLNTNLERYGDICPLRLQSIRNKCRDTNVKRFGVYDPSQSSEIMDKIRKTNLIRYGVEWTTLGVSREKQYASQCEKYGTRFFASEIGKETLRKSRLESENIPKDGIRKRLKNLNKLEQKVQDASDDLMYVGHGIFWKYLPALMGSKNPDFVIPGSDPEHPFRNIKKVVEALGIYWHGSERTGLQRDEYESQLISAYSDIGISCLIIWEDEVKKSLSICDKIKLFIESPEIIDKNEYVNMNDESSGVIRDSNSDIFTFLQTHHYSGFGRNSIVTYSIRYGGKLAAVAKFSYPIRQTISDSIGVESRYILELDRLCIHPSCHIKNMASWFLSRVVKLLRKDFKYVRKLVSFADPEAGHVGTIYAASNWENHGFTSYSYFYMLPSGMKMNKKTLFNKSKTSGMKEREYAKSIGAVRISTRPKSKFVLSI
ncbi:MAG TPA: hypothetical protein ENI61_03275 [Ignavibacteria bacterium]|nr:hypothetical protein [Ignavibacteria bacterium]